MIMWRRYAWKENPFPIIDETAFPADGMISVVDEYKQSNAHSKE